MDDTLDSQCITLFENCQDMTLYNQFNHRIIISSRVNQGPENHDYPTYIDTSSVLVKNMHKKSQTCGQHIFGIF